MMNNIAINSFMFENERINNLIEMIDSQIIGGLGLYSGHSKEYSQLPVEKKERFSVLSYYVHFMDIEYDKIDIDVLSNKMKLCSVDNIKSITVILSNKKEHGKWEDRLLKLCEEFYKLNKKYGVLVLIEILGKEQKNQFCITSISKAREIDKYIDRSKLKWIVDCFHSNEEYNELECSFFTNVYSVHLSCKNFLNNKREFLVEGDSEIKKYIDRIKSFDYKGWWEFEVLEQKLCTRLILEKIYLDINEILYR